MMPALVRRTIFLASLSLPLTCCPPAALLAGEADVNPLQLSPDHATASVADLEKESAWYQRVLGFVEIKRFRASDDFEVRNLSLAGYRIDLVWQRGSSRPHDVDGYFKQGWMHVVFRTRAIDAAYKRLVDLGTDVKVSKSPQAAIGRLTFHDPEGNELEIVPVD